MKAKRHDGKSLCNDCDYGPANAPGLLGENQDAWDLWLEVHTQRRFSGALDYNIVYLEAERQGIELSICTMKKIKALERYELKQAADD